jgi:hypothetical protein
VLRHGLAIISVGAAIGIVAAAATGPLLAHLLYGVSPHDPLALVAGPGALTVVALLAIGLPCAACNGGGSDDGASGRVALESEWR